VSQCFYPEDAGDDGTVRGAESHVREEVRQVRRHHREDTFEPGGSVDKFDEFVQIGDKFVQNVVKFVKFCQNRDLFFTLKMRAMMARCAGRSATWGRACARYAVTIGRTACTHLQHSATYGRSEQSVSAFSPDSQGRNLALTVVYVPYSLISGGGRRASYGVACTRYTVTIGTTACTRI